MKTLLCLLSLLAGLVTSQAQSNPTVVSVTTPGFSQSTVDIPVSRAAELKVGFFDASVTAGVVCLKDGIYTKMFEGFVVQGPCRIFILSGDQTKSVLTTIAHWPSPKSTKGVVVR